MGPGTGAEEHKVVPSKANNSVTEGKLEDPATILYTRCGNHYLIPPLSGVHDLAVDHAPVKENANVSPSEHDDECLGGPEFSVKALDDKTTAPGPTIIKLFASEDKEMATKRTYEVVKHALSERSRSSL